MLDILLLTSRGNCRQQQDAISVNSEVIQADEHLSQRSAETPELLLGLADGVATSPAAARASRLALGFLSQSLAGSPDDCMDGLMTGRHLRAVQHKLSATLAGNAIKLRSETHSQQVGQSRAPFASLVENCKNNTCTWIRSPL